MYGPTETTVWSSCFQVTDIDMPIEIGQPIDNTQCYILDEQQRLLPAGVPGELYIGGEGVSLGYLHSDDLTQERFIERADFAKGLLYRTGDRVTRLPQGVLRYHNRLDFQVKIRGFRIELGEIEHRLLTTPGISAGVVVAQDQHILAFYLTQGQKLSKLKVRKHLAETLPKHMMPDYYILLDALPLTPAGKVDRKHLGNYKVQAPETSGGQKPQTPSELYFGEVWAGLLKRDITSLSVQDNFFDVGGHSLLSLQVVAKAKKEHGLTIPATALVLNTLGQLAANYPVPDAIPNQAVPNLTVGDGQMDSKHKSEAAKPEVWASESDSKSPGNVMHKLKQWWQKIKET